MAARARHAASAGGLAFALDLVEYGVLEVSESLSVVAYSLTTVT